MFGFQLTVRNTLNIPVATVWVLTACWYLTKSVYGVRTQKTTIWMLKPQISPS